jgi:hypothetical protein
MIYLIYVYKHHYQDAFDCRLPGSFNSVFSFFLKKTLTQLLSILLTKNQREQIMIQSRKFGY